ncbi:MAG: UDP-N-acetylmuramoyl-L-alanyl-D-glutamate--2,6-diaminopimelate ligase, partial [Deltaproteobacteria bacterium CG_4_10_14_0_2_um_filter_43_8]
MAIKNITYDSRQVLPGYCFVAIRGEHADGHDYIESAVKNGAAVIVSDHPVSVPENVKNIIVKDT